MGLVLSSRREPVEQPLVMAILLSVVKCGQLVQEQWVRVSFYASPEVLTKILGIFHSNDVTCCTIAYWARRRMNRTLEHPFSVDPLFIPQNDANLYWCVMPCSFLAHFHYRICGILPILCVKRTQLSTLP